MLLLFTHHVLQEYINQALLPPDGFGSTKYEKACSAGGKRFHSFF